MATPGNLARSGAVTSLEDGQDMHIQQASTAGGANARNISAQEIQREMATLRYVGPLQARALARISQSLTKNLFILDSR